MQVIVDYHDGPNVLRELLCRMIYYLLGDLDTATAYLDIDCKANAQVIADCT